MKVTGWTDWEDPRFKSVDDMTDKEYDEARDAIIKEIREKGYKIAGNSHQYCDNCCPVIDNKYIYCVSMRSWGKIMAAALNLPNEDGYAYVHWAWGEPADDEEVLPNE